MEKNLGKNFVEQNLKMIFYLKQNDFPEEREKHFNQKNYK